MRNKKNEINLAKLKEAFPKVKGIDWNTILKTESDVFEEIVSSTAKIDISKKSNVPIQIANKKFAQINDTDYSELPFLQALDILWGKSSVRQISSKTGIPSASVHRIKLGKMEPSYEHMEEIAKAFGKQPTFFIEYRIGMILSAVNDYLMRSPETATAWSKLIKKKGGIKL